jgi:hypothetical protein
MAATPKSGTFCFRDKVTGELYEIDLYVSDVNGAAVTFDGGAGAGASSPDFVTFANPVVLVDYSQVTGTADTTKMRLTAGGSPLRTILRYAIHLTSLATRPALNIPFKANTRIGAIQMT